MGEKWKKTKNTKLLLLAHFKQNIQYLSLQRGNFTDLLKVQGFFTFIILLIGFFSYIFSVKCLIFGYVSEFNQKWEKSVNDVIKLYSVKYLCLQISNFHILSQCRICRHFIILLEGFYAFFFFKVNQFQYF